MVLFWERLMDLVEIVFHFDSVLILAMSISPGLSLFGLEHLFFTAPPHFLIITLAIFLQGWIYT